MTFTHAPRMFSLQRTAAEGSGASREASTGALAAVRGYDIGVVVPSKACRTATLGGVGGCLTT